MGAGCVDGAPAFEDVFNSKLGFLRAKPKLSPEEETEKELWLHWPSVFS